VRERTFGRGVAEAGEREVRVDDGDADGEDGVARRWPAAARVLGVALGEGLSSDRGACERWPDCRGTPSM
jgi:hypothetical protein